MERLTMTDYEMDEIRQYAENFNCPIKTEEDSVTQKFCNLVCDEFQDDCPFAKVGQKLKHYEDAEENGLLIHLPCRVGDTVYFPQETNGECELYVDVGMVFAIGLDEKHTMWISARYESGLKFYHTSDDIGKTVFLTMEAAEQALKQMGDSKHEYSRSN